MSAIAIHLKPDFKKLALGLLFLLFTTALIFFAASRIAATRGVSDVPLKPCATCVNCVCPKMLGSVACGCPR